MSIFSKKDKKEDNASSEVSAKKSDKAVKAPKKVAKKTTSKPAKTVKKAKKAKPKSKSESKLGLVAGKELANVILKPRITEKAAVKADVSNAYTFEVDPKATKIEVAAAIEKIYKVVPVKVNMTKIQRKAVGVRRGKGFKGGGKKAVVYLQKGDSIEFV